MFFGTLLALAGFLAANAESVPILKSQAAALKAKGDAQGALAKYEAALQLSPKSAELEDEVGFLLAVLSRQAQAKQHLQRALELQPEFAPARYHLGVMEWLQGNREVSLPLLAEAVRLDPRQADY